MGHKFLPPSGAYKWVKCAFNPSLEAAAPDDDDTLESREGTAAHEVGEDMIRAHLRGGVGAKLKAGEFASNGVLISQEIYESAKVYADAVGHELKLAGVFSEEWVLIEHFFDAPEIHDLNGGTPDLVFFNAKTGELWIWDYKHGHRSVEAFENWQLINYASPALKHFGINGATDQNITVKFRIVMPRCFDGLGAVREWDVKASDLRGYFNQLRDAAIRATSGDVQATPSVNCRDCSGRLQCDAYRDLGGHIADYAARGATHELDGVALGLELEWLERASKTLGGRLEALKAETATRISKGETVNGWGLQNGSARLAWLCDDETVIGTGAALGVDIAAPIAAKTPTQALEIVKGDADATAAIKALSKRPKGSAKLVREEKTLAARVFSNSNQGV
jgi:hypothetical protein